MHRGPQRRPSDGGGAIGCGVAEALRIMSTGLIWGERTDEEIRGDISSGSAKGLAEWKAAGDETRKERERAGAGGMDEMGEGK